MDMKRQRDLAIFVASLFAALCVFLAVKGDFVTLRYVASASSDKYHKPSCEYAERIYDGYKIYYRRKEAAEADGRTPCALCITD